MTKICFQDSGNFLKTKIYVKWHYFCAKNVAFRVQFWKFKFSHLTYFIATLPRLLYLKSIEI